MRAPLLFTALLAAALFHNPSRAEPAPAEWPIDFRDGLIRVRLSAPSSDRPLEFLLDTGASVSVIDLKTADRLGLKRGDRVRVRGVHSSLTGYFPTALSAAMGAMALPREFLALDLRKLSDACDAAVDGLLGLDFFRDRIVQIDFAAGRIRLLDPRRESPTDEIVPLEVRPCGMRVPVGVNDGPARWMRLDTGCASDLQWVTGAVDPARCRRRLAVGLDRISIPQTTTRLRIGALAFDNVPTGIHHREIFPGEAGLLGNGVLARFDAVTIDAKSGRLILTPRR